MATVAQQVEDSAPNFTSTNKKQQKKKRRTKNMMRFLSLFPAISCPPIETANEDGNIDMTAASASAGGGDGVHDTRRTPSHLVVTVNGIVGSAEDWRYTAEQFEKQYPEYVHIHRSVRNSAKSTFDGVDVMGDRLADEVISVIERCPDLRKISFLGHSLGGLIARYAIARLYQRNCFLSRFPSTNGGSKESFGKQAPGENSEQEITGLEPMNFITFATPHLGSRGPKHIPLFCGFHMMEIVARQTSGLLGRTGKHLFLTDNDDGKYPLLLRMANDSEDLPFISALKSFRRRVLYANVQFDNLVGWSTSSLRRRNELPKRKCLSRNVRYRHIVNVEATSSMNSGEIFPLDSETSGLKPFNTNAMMEVMLRGLGNVSWERVDVKFNGTIHRFLAHTMIQVTHYQDHPTGADVIQHMIDNFLL